MGIQEMLELSSLEENITLMLPWKGLFKGSTPCGRNDEFDPVDGVLNQRY